MSEAGREERTITTGQHATDAHVIGADLGGTHLRLALADLAGTVRARWSTSTVGIRDPHQIIDLIAQGTTALLAESSVPRSSLRSIAVGAPGVTDVDRGIVLATSYLLGWRDVPLAALLESALGIPAAVDNDVNVATLAESWAGAAKGVPNFAFLAVGTGIGAGIFLNGAPLRGNNWLAGEIGYMLVPGVSEVPAGESAPGGLESIAGGHAIRTRWQALVAASPTPLPPDLHATAIFDLASTGEPTATAVLAQTARVLAYAVYNISLIIDVPLIVFGGSVGVHPALLTSMRSLLESRTTRALPTLTASALGTDAQLLGAIRLAIERAQLSA